MKVICKKVRDKECDPMDTCSCGEPHEKNSRCQLWCQCRDEWTRECVPVVPEYVRVTQSGEVSVDKFTFYYHSGDVHKVRGDAVTRWLVSAIITDENDPCYIRKAHCEPCEAPEHIPTPYYGSHEHHVALNVEYQCKLKKGAQGMKAMMICETVETDGKCPYAWAGPCDRSEPHEEGGCCDKVKCVPDGTRCTERCVPSLNVIRSAAAKIWKQEMEKEFKMSDEKTLPNCGVNFCLGTYKIEVEVNPGRQPSRKLVMEGGATGLYFDKLFDQIRADVDRLEKMAMDIVGSDE